MPTRNWSASGTSGVRRVKSLRNGDACITDEISGQRPSLHPPAEDRPAQTGWYANDVGWGSRRRWIAAEKLHAEGAIRCTHWHPTKIVPGGLIAPTVLRGSVGPTALRWTPRASMARHLNRCWLRCFGFSAGNIVSRQAW